MKETIEEAAERCFEVMKSLNPRGGIKEFVRLAVNFGANWQAKRMYSEEDIISLLDFVNNRLPDLYSRFSSEEEFDEWSKQFKTIYHEEN